MPWGISDGDNVNEAYMNDLIEAALGDGNPAQGASYVIFKDGSDYKARNGTDGTIDYSGTDAATVIQAAITALASTGGKVFIQKGTYTLNSQISLVSNLVLCGEGPDATKLVTGDATGETYILYASVKSYITLRDLYVEGVRAGTKSAIVFSNCNHCLVENCHIYGTNADGVLVSDSSSAVYVVNCHIKYCGGSSIYEYSAAHDNFFLNNVCENNSENGIAISTNCYLDLIAGNTCIENNWAGIVIHGDCLGERIINNNCRRNNEEGIIVETDSHRTIIMGNWCEDNDYQDTGTYGGIEVGGEQNATYGNCDDTLIIGNVSRTANNKQAYGIIIRYATCENTRVSLNNLNSNKTANISDSGTGSIIHHNLGFVTECDVLGPQFAIDAVAVVSTTIPHGLDYTPATSDCQLTLVEDTAVDDFELGFIKVDNSTPPDATNVYAIINVTNASATGGAKAKIALRVRKA